MINFKKKLKYIIIIGCGRLGSELALKLSKNNSVVIVDKEDKSFNRLANMNFTGFTMTIDTSDMEALNRLKLKSANLVYVVTPDDNVNFMLAYGIKKLNYNIRVIARVNDPLKKSIFERAKLELFCPIENSVNELVSELESDDN